MISTKFLIINFAVSFTASLQRKKKEKNELQTFCIFKNVSNATTRIIVLYF